MAMTPGKDPPSPAFLDTVEEITRIYRSLPPRPSIEEVEAATSTVETVNTEENMKLQEISMQQVPPGVPEELFSVLRELKRTVVVFQSLEQRREALYLLQMEKLFQTSADLIQRASELVSGDAQKPRYPSLCQPVAKVARDVAVIGDESLVKKRGDEEPEKISLNVERGSSAKASFSAGKLQFLSLSRGFFSENNPITCLNGLCLFRFSFTKYTRIMF